MNRRALVVFLLLFTSCGSSLMVMEKGYEGRKIPKASLGVIVRNNPPAIDYSGNVEPEFGPGDQNALIFKYFKTGIVEDIKSQTSLAQATFLDERVDPSLFSTDREVNLPNGTRVEVAIPAPGTHFSFRDSTAGFLLILDHLYIGTSIESHTYWSGGAGFETPGLSAAVGVDNSDFANPEALWAGSWSAQAFGPPMMPSPPIYSPMPHTTTTKDLTYEADIVIWDNSAGSLVACGHVMSKVGSFIIPVITKSTWTQLTSQFVAAIFENTPFVGTAESR
jgi:hypothetical protein